MSTQSSILVWRIPWTEETGGLSPWGHKELHVTEQLKSTLPTDIIGASLVAHMVKNLPEMTKTQVQSLGLDGLLEEEMATHSSIPAWRIPWTEEPGGLPSMGSQRVGHD